MTQPPIPGKICSQAQQVALAAPLLRTMLQDRCKLVAHTVPTEIDGYAWSSASTEPS